MQHETRGSAMLLAATLIWGTSLVAQSVGTSYVGALTFNAVRFFIGALTLSPYLVYARKKEKYFATIDRNTLAAGAICGCVIFITATLQQIGISFTTVGKAGFLTALYIVFVPLLGLIFKKKVQWYIWICIVAAMVGMYLLCIQDNFYLGFGDTLVFLCAISTAIHILLIGCYSKRVNGVLLSCIQFLVCGVLSLLAALLFEEISLAAIWAAKGPILYTGIFSCGIAYTLQVLGQKHVSPVIAALILSMESVFSVFSGWVILGETLSTKEIVGCALMLIAIIVSQLPDAVNDYKVHLKAQK